MANIQENVQNFDKEKEFLEKHCLCLSLESDIVHLPQGYAYDALKIDVSAKGFRRAREKLEQIWQESMGWINYE